MYSVSEELGSMYIFCNFSFANGPVPTTYVYVLDKHSMCLTKYSQLNFCECRLICEIRENSPVIISTYVCDSLHVSTQV